MASAVRACLCVCVLLAGAGAGAARYNLTVGYLTTLRGDSVPDRQGLAISGALSMALEQVNNDTSLLPHVRLLMRWENTMGDTVVATRAITDMVCQGVVAFFGPEGTCHTEAIVAQARNLPMISYKCSDYQTSAIPTFARTEPTDRQVTKSVISLLRYYRWHKFSILYEKPWEMVALSLELQAKVTNMTVNHLRTVHDNKRCCEDKLTCCSPGFWYQFVQDTKNRTRIYVLMGTATVLKEMMTAMDSLQLFAKGEYVVIFVDKDTYTNTKEALKYLMKTQERTALSGCRMSADFKLRARSLLVVVATPPTLAYENFTDKVLQYNTRMPFNFSLPSIFDKKKKFVSIYAAYLYDAVILYARALHKLFTAETKLSESRVREIATNGTKIVATMIQSTPYTSISGATIKLDEHADSEGNFSVLAFKQHRFGDDEEVSAECQFNMVPVGNFLQAGRAYPEFKPLPGLSIEWLDNRKPEDEPSCGFMDEKCPKDDSQAGSIIVAGGLAIILFCSLVVTASIYRKWKIELEIEGLLWKIELKDIRGYSTDELICSPSKVSMVSGISNESRYGAQMFASVGRYRGNVVRIKELKFSKKKDMSREVMKEMRLLRDLRNDNINSFIGAVVEPIRILLITDYCPRGSLYDIIENEDIKLDKMFISSLIHDLLKGMIFIHSSLLVFHGNLKSSNCVVTSRWVLQVTDFGLHEIKACAESESIGEHQYYRSLLWKAPELLRALENPNVWPVYGSQKGDVYAFGIILYEIITRKGPFGITHLEPKEIVERVRRVAAEGEPVFRPELPGLRGAEEYAATCVPLLRDCWSEDPAHRPDFVAVRARLKRLKSDKYRNIMDQMMDMMEKYSNNLEELVEERTSLLIEEKKKTEDLLHRMLPKSVAQKLTTGQGVEPESFDSVTIYFSDIVGFTAMSAESTPLQVVNFLNDLYTIFDRIIRAYDVYKVETIGDAYMVVSGLPIRNNTKHVGEIASMALELLHAVRTIKIPHQPTETLKLRIGIHTGAVVAGVVGLTMPRYCLFGDTVNTASRMESTGEALRIHVSPSCRAALEVLGGYVLEPRGKVLVKGKGELQTYWLLGATERAVQKRSVDEEELAPLFSQPRRSPKLPDSRLASVSAGCGNRFSALRSAATAAAGAGGGSVTSLGKTSPARSKHKPSTSPYGSVLRARHVLNSRAGAPGPEGGAPETALRYACSLDVFPVPPPGPYLAQLDDCAAPAAPARRMLISTVSGRTDAADGAPLDSRDEDSPLLRKSSLYNKWEQPKKKEGNNVEFHKRWHSVEALDENKTERHRKLPRLDIKQWLRDMWPAPGLERESVV